MGRFFKDFKDKGKKVVDYSKIAGQKMGNKISSFADKQTNKRESWSRGRLSNEKERFLGENPANFDDNFFDDNLFNASINDNPYIDNVQPAQKPASFHHFILENKYQDLEKSIRGYKDVYNKERDKWEIKRKGQHCFTDEEAEEILRTAQSHLATDIKLTFYSKDTFGFRFLAIYEKLEFLFKRIMEYRYGRFGDSKKQGEMKEQALKIFVELITRIEANYLRAIQGMENKYTHQSVQSQESLQGRGEDEKYNRRYT